MFHEFTQVVHQQLSSIHGKRGNHDGASALRRPADHVSEFVRYRAGRMIAIAVGCFAQQNVRVRGQLRILQNWLIEAAHIA